MTVEDIITSLPDPGDIGQAEYQVVYDLILESLADNYEEDSGYTPEGYVDAMLDMVVHHVNLIRNRLSL